MTTYVRPSGAEIELQDTDNHKALAKARGWEKKDDKSEIELNDAPATVCQADTMEVIQCDNELGITLKPKPKRKRRTKSQIEADKALGNA